MRKNPFQYLTDYHKDKVARSRTVMEFMHTQTDSYVTWIIGFSFTGLLLIASSLDKIKHSQPTGSLVVLLFISILCGVLYRFISYRMMLLYKSLDDYYYGYFQDMLMTPTENEYDLETMNYKELVEAIKFEFDYDVPLVDTDEKKASEEPKLRKFYLELIEHSKKQFDIGMNHLLDADEDLLRISREKTLKKQAKQKDNPKHGFNFPLWTVWLNIFYIGSAGAFLIAIGILCISLLIWFF